MATVAVAVDRDTPHHAVAFVLQMLRTDGINADLITAPVPQDSHKSIEVGYLLSQRLLSVVQAAQQQAVNANGRTWRELLSTRGRLSIYNNVPKYDISDSQFQQIVNPGRLQVSQPK